MARRPRLVDPDRQPRSDDMRGSDAAEDRIEVVRHPVRQTPAGLGKQAMRQFRADVPIGQPAADRSSPGGPASEARPRREPSIAVALGQRAPSMAPAGKIGRAVPSLRRVTQ